MSKMLSDDLDGDIKVICVNGVVTNRKGGNDI